MSCFSWQEFGFPPHSLGHSRCAPAGNTNANTNTNTTPAHGGGFPGVGGIPERESSSEIYSHTSVRQLGPHWSLQQVPVTQHPNPCSARNPFPVDEDGIGMAGGLLEAGRGPVPTPPGPQELLQSLWLLPLGKAAQSLLQQCLEAPLGCPVWITVRRQPCLSFP